MLCVICLGSGGSATFPESAPLTERPFCVFKEAPMKDPTKASKDVIDRACVCVTNATFFWVNLTKNTIFLRS